MKAVLLVLMLALLMSGVASAAWHDDWDYRTPIEIDGNTEDLTDYQVNVSLQGTNSAAANYIDFDKVLAGGADIRFTDSDQTTEIDFWVEEWIDTPDAENAIVWVNTPSIFEAGTTTVYAYYGKADVSSGSDGDGTFEFFDGFDYRNIDLDSHEIYEGTRDWAVGGIEMPNGNIIAAWESNIAETSNAGIIKASMSADGEDWGAMYTLQDTLNLRDVEPQFFVDGNTVFFFYGTMDGNHPDWESHMFYKTSIDNGSTWSSSTELPTGCLGGRVHPVSNPIRKSFSPNIGRIILPVFIKKNATSDWYASTLYSDDDCTTWNRGGNTEISSANYVEPTIVEKGNGELYMLLRRYRDGAGLWQYQTTSVDGGGSWGEVTSSTIRSPSAQSQLLRLHNGHFILLWNDISASSNTPRLPLTVAISTDNCLTWSVKKNIREGSGQYNNMGLLQRTNGDIIALYTNEIDYIIMSSVFTENDISLFHDKWDIVGTPTITFSDTIMSIRLQDASYIETKTFNQSPPAILEVRSKDVDYGTSNYPAAYGFGMYHGSSYDTYGVRREVGTAEKYILLVNDLSGRDLTTSFWRDTNFAKYMLEWTVDIVHLYKNGIKLDSDDVTTHIPTTTLKVNVGRTYYTSGSDGIQFDIDWIFVRNYTSTEPIVSTTSAFRGYDKIFTGVVNTISPIDYVSYSAEPTVSNLVNMTTAPTSALTINVTTFTEPLKRYNESAASDTYALYTVGEGDADTTYVVNIFADVNSTKMQTFRIKANDTGYIKYNTTGYGYDRWTEIKPATEPAGTIVIISVCGAVLFGGGAWVIRRWRRKN